MRAPELPDDLVPALDALAGLADATDAATLAALRDRLAAARLRVLVVGEAKRGPRAGPVPPRRSAIRRCGAAGQPPTGAGRPSWPYPARSRLVELTKGAAERWRQAQSERLEDGLGRLGVRLARDLAAELDAIRGAATELLGLELSVPVPQERLAPDRRFFYPAAENVDQAELLAGAVRRMLPGQAGRRLARDHVLGEVGDLAARQIGRARADLQYRLAEATRQLTLEMGRRYTGSTDRLASALRTAGALREQAAGEASGQLAALSDRERALRRVTDRLDVASGRPEDP